MQSAQGHRNVTEIPAIFAMDEPAHRWREPARSVASRRPSEKPSRTSSRPIFVEPNDNRELLGESELEAKAFYVLTARPDCERIFEQPAPVSYVDHEGKTRRHTFDLLMVQKSRNRIAVAVKPLALAKKYGLDGLLRYIAKQMNPDFATGVLLLTDAKMRPADVQNGRLIHDARRHPDLEIDDRVRAVAESLQGATTIECIIQAAGIDGHDQSFYSVARAIGIGMLVPTMRGLITRNSQVRGVMAFGSPP